VLSIPSVYPNYNFSIPLVYHRSFSIMMPVWPGNCQASRKQEMYLLASFDADDNHRVMLLGIGDYFVAAGERGRNVDLHDLGERGGRINIKLKLYSVASSPCTSSAFSELVNGGTRSHRADVLDIVWDTPSLNGHPLWHVAGVTAVDIDGHPPEEGERERERKREREKERESSVFFSTLTGREEGGPKI